jgi:branched-chain amino acid transport system permease protein
MIWVSTVIQGILLGGLYALFACGLWLMFGVMKVINLAHGDLAVLAAYLALGVVAVVTIPPCTRSSWWCRSSRSPATSFSAR